MYRTTSSIIVAALVFVAAPAASAEIRIDLAGSVYYLTADMTGSFRVGERATAWFTYDPSSPGRAWYPGGVLDPTVYFYEHAPTGGGMQVGSYTVRFNDAARMFVTNDEPASNGPIDRVIFDNFGAEGDAVAGRPLDVVSINFQDNTATALSDLRLPNSAATFAALPDVRASLDWRPYIGAAHRVAVIFDSVAVSAVPEPASWMLMIGGVGLVGGVLRQQRRPRIQLA